MGSTSSTCKGMQQAASRCSRLLGSQISRLGVVNAFAAGHDIVEASRLAAALHSLTPLKASSFWSTASPSPSARTASTSEPGLHGCCSYSTTQGPRQEAQAPTAASLHSSVSSLQSAYPQPAHVDEEIIYPHEHPIRFPFHARAFFVGKAPLSSVMAKLVLQLAQCTTQTCQLLCNRLS